MLHVADTRSFFGFHFPPIIATIINEAFFALEDNLATREDIDRAMKYGTNYPKGPFEWLDSVPPKYIRRLLDEMFEIVTWRQLLTETNRDLARQGLYSESLLDEMLSLVKEFREGEQQARSD